jgi:hypothetical protein
LALRNVSALGVLLFTGVNVCDFCAHAEYTLDTLLRGAEVERALEKFEEKEIGGRGEIRTHDTVARTPDFESGALNHSATLPPELPQSAQRFGGWSNSPLRARLRRRRHPRAALPTMHATEKTTSGFHWLSWCDMIARQRRGEIAG